MTVKYIIVKYRKFQNIHKNTSFFTFKPLGKLFYKKSSVDAFCGTNISSTTITLKIKYFHSTASLSEMVLCTAFKWVSFSTYVNNGTAKVPILAKIGVRVQ